jgi:fimbrial chaperone protein
MLLKWAQSAAAPAISAACILASPAMGGSLQVAPTTVEFGASPATTLTLKAAGQATLPVQVRVFQWAQNDGREALLPAFDIAASPPQARLAPGASYTVRLVSRGAASGPERAYRLLVDELPQADRAPAGAVTMLLRYSIPVFAGGNGQPPRLAWSARLSGGQIEIRAVNSGGRRARLSSVKASAGGRSVVFAEGLLGYALAGGTMAWSRPVPAGFGGAVRISGETEAGPFDAVVALQR